MQASGRHAKKLFLCRTLLEGFYRDEAISQRCSSFLFGQRTQLLGGSRLDEMRRKERLP
jgi:hypothetical protein